MMINVVDNKRGAELSLFGTIGGFLIIAALVVLLFLFLTGTFGDLGRGAGTVPGAEALHAEICAALVSQGGVGAIQDYCYNFKEVENDEWINCQDVEPILESDGVGFLDCNGDLVIDEMEKLCKEAGENDQDDVIVNDRSCEDRFTGLFVGDDSTPVFTYAWSSGVECEGDSVEVADSFCEGDNPGSGPSIKKCCRLF